jgi:NitT/TauT family transport system substrate-binding protein
MSWSRRRFLLGSGAALALSAGPRIVRAAPAKLTDVTVLFARLTPGPDYSFLWAADALGYFREEGLNVTVQPTNGSPEVARLVAAGQGDFGLPGAEATIISVSKGLPIVDVFCVQQRMIYSVGAPQASSIARPADLKGQRIGVQSLTASPVFVAKAVIKAAGLNPDRDVTFVPIGIGAQAVAAVKAGQVDAVAFHDTQFLQFEMAGVPFRLFPMPAFANHFTAGITVKSDTVAKRPEIVVGFGRAIAKGLLYSFTNPQASIKAMQKVVPGTAVKDPEGALAELKQRLTYEELPPQAKGKWGWNTPERYGRFADFLLDVGVINRKVDGAKLFDGRFLDQINAFDAKAVIEAAKSA